MLFKPRDKTRCAATAQTIKTAIALVMAVFLWATNAAAQGARFDSVAQTTSVLSGLTVSTPIPGATVTVCSVAQIASASEIGTTVTLTFFTPHGFSPGQQIKVYGAGVSGYNGNFTITTVPLSTSLTYIDSNSGLGAAGGGVAAPNNTPCTPVATVYTDQSLGTTAANPFTTDSQGNFGFWGAGGTYVYTVTGTGISPSLFYLTLPGGFGAAPNGNPVFTTLITKTSPAIDVRAYGAVCDGSTNDTTAIANAFAAAVSGSTILIPGTCVTSGVTLSASGVTLTGSGTLKKLANVDGVLLKITGSRNAVLELEFDSTAAQPTLNGDQNDTVQIFGGNNNRIFKNHILGNSASNCVAILGGSENEIGDNELTSCYANSVFIACQSAVSCSPATDNNNVHGNTADGTTTQDCIFFTASPGSLATTNFINHNLAVNNILKNCADSPIEMGIHSFMSIVANNTVSAKGNNGILTRDSQGNNISTNTIEMLSTATGDGIDILNQLENVAFDYQTSVINNTIRGKIARACIYSSASNVKIEENNCEDTFIVPNAAGSNLEGYCGILGTSNSPASISDVGFSNNKCKNLNIGVEANFAAGVLNYDRLFIDYNKFDGVNTAGIDVSNLTLTKSDISGNRFNKVAGVAINNTNTVTDVSDYIGLNHYSLAGWSGTGTQASQAWTAGTPVFEYNLVGALGVGAVPTGGQGGDLFVSRSATTGLLGFGSNGSNFILFSTTFRFTASITPNVAATGAIGTNALPWNQLCWGQAATNNTCTSTNALTAARTLNTPDGNSNTVITAALVTTAATSDNVAVQGMTASGHCSLEPTNAAAATNIATTFLSAVTTNQITVTHTATANMNYHILCTPQ